MLIVQFNVADPLPWSLVGRARTFFLQINHQVGRSNLSAFGAVLSWVGDLQKDAPVMAAAIDTIYNRAHRGTGSA